MPDQPCLKSKRILERWELKLILLLVLVNLARSGASNVHRSSPAEGDMSKCGTKAVRGIEINLN